MSVFGGAAVGLVGRLVGKFGSVGDFGLVMGVPGVLVWQPVDHDAQRDSNGKRPVVPSSSARHRGVSVGQRAQLRGAVAGVGRAVHERQRSRAQVGELLQRRPEVSRQPGGVEDLLGLQRRCDTVGFGQGRALVRHG